MQLEPRAETGQVLLSGAPSDTPWKGSDGLGPALLVGGGGMVAWDRVGQRSAWAWHRCGFPDAGERQTRPGGGGVVSNADPPPSTSVSWFWGLGRVLGISMLTSHSPIQEVVGHTLGALRCHLRPRAEIGGHVVAKGQGQ